MNAVAIIVLILMGFLLYRVIFSYKRQEGYKQWKEGKNSYAGRNESTKSAYKRDSAKYIQSLLSKSSTALKFDDGAIAWCANFLGVEQESLKDILNNIPAHYRGFWVGKRRGGYRMIWAPVPKLKAIQNTIYHRILLPVNIHPAATGFRRQCSIADNVRPHLGKSLVLKTDLHDFFDSISSRRVRNMFYSIGYPRNVSKVFGALCCAFRHLPQGATTSPAISNIIARNMDRKLAELAAERGLVYTRYADDITFSGDNMSKDELLLRINKITRAEEFKLNRKKTRFLKTHQRKIITGVSISSGVKLTIPRAKKREIRKNVHFILTKGLVEHQLKIGSSDPAYLKRLIGMLCYWRSIEPYNVYVSNSIAALKRLKNDR